MFTSGIEIDKGLIIVENRESTISTSIHMMFMNYDIAAIWINSQMEVVDLQIAKRWRLSYAPQAPAQFVLEAHPSRLGEFSIGDVLKFENA
jgi:uncharacterized membrane protein (UPF0127 family)